MKLAVGPMRGERLPFVLLNHVPPRVVRQAGSRPGPGEKSDSRPVVMVKGAGPQRRHCGLGSCLMLFPS